MKIERYLDKLQKIIQLQPDINLQTFKLLLETFKQCLSKKEIERWSFTINLIAKYNDKQESILKSIQKAKNYKPK